MPFPAWSRGKPLHEAQIETRRLAGFGTLQVLPNECWVLLFQPSCDLLTLVGCGELVLFLGPVTDITRSLSVLSRIVWRFVAVEVIAEALA